MRRRPFLILASAALALVAAVQPAAAFTELGSAGSTYAPQFTDEMAAPGATCLYNDNSGTTNDTLKSLKVRKFFTHSPFAKKSYVGYRVTILRNGSPYKTTTMIKRKANLEEVAFFGPTIWQKPAGLSGKFQAVVKLTFYNPSGVKKGNSRHIVDVYNNKLGTSGISFTNGDPGDPFDYEDAHTPGFCYAKYPD
jgi:hypothetical protein